jgi:hypothetical protein
MKLVKKNFKFVEPYFQATWRYVAVGNEEFFQKEWDSKPRTLNLAPLDNKKYLYFYLVCSNNKLTQKLEPIAATGQHHSDRQIIGDWENISKELDRRQKRIDELYEIIEKTNEQKQNIEDELKLIKNSKSYAAAQKISLIKGKVKRG